MARPGDSRPLWCTLSFSEDLDKAFSLQSDTTFLCVLAVGQSGNHVNLTQICRQKV